jgi:hypothetical protein
MMVLALQMDENHDRVNSRQGKEALFTEKGWTVLVTVAGVNASSWGVRLRLTPLRPPTSEPQSVDDFSLSAAWSVFSEGDDTWAGHYVGWNLWFNPRLIEAAKDIVAQHPTQSKAELTQLVRRYWREPKQFE